MSLDQRRRRRPRISHRLRRHERRGTVRAAKLRLQAALRSTRRCPCRSDAGPVAGHAQPARGLHLACCRRRAPYSRRECRSRTARRARRSRSRRCGEGARAMRRPPPPPRPRMLSTFFVGAGRQEGAPRRTAATWGGLTGSRGRPTQRGRRSVRLRQRQLPSRIRATAARDATARLRFPHVPEPEPGWPAGRHHVTKPGAGAGRTSRPRAPQQSARAAIAPHRLVADTIVGSRYAVGRSSVGAECDRRTIRTTEGPPAPTLARSLRSLRNLPSPPHTLAPDPTDQMESQRTAYLPVTL